MSGLAELFNVTPETVKRIQETTKELEKAVELYQRRNAEKLATQKENR